MINFVYCVTTVTLFSAAALADYGPSDDVIELTPNNFHKTVVMSDELWLVEFYAPWCGHCKNLEPEWKKAATALKGVVKVGAVNADEHRTLGGQYGVQGFPTIKVFGADKYKPEAYNGGRQSKDIIEQALNQARAMVMQRVSGKGGSKSGGSGGGSGKKSDPADVIELTDSNFQKLVLDSTDIWMVEFFAPWCGHCKNLAPHWEQAATELKGKVKLGALDATVHTVTAGRYGIQGFPTIKIFPAGVKDGSAEDYQGGRTASDIVRQGEDLAAENVPPPEIIQLTEQKTLTDACDEHQLCVIAVLPHILDCQSKCRKDYIDLLTQLGAKYKKKMWGWVWAEAGSQMDLEESLGIGGFGYPAMAAVNSRKAKFALLKGSFSEQGLNEFLRDLSFGRGSTAPLKNAKLPTVVKTEPWDGKDGVLEVEDDIDLSDVDLDDLDDADDKGKKTEL
ncbi:protein disulfide-isomerase A6-like [Liolophura sinensis]|uniref:protein disulfide-isomerase A6-like n=1 Tax=Liolophura sinensis TaxID=3198878 RepID=UPI0031586592